MDDRFPEGRNDPDPNFKNADPQHRITVRDEDPTFFSTDPDPTGEKNVDPDPTLNRNEEKKYIHILGCRHNIICYEP